MSLIGSFTGIRCLFYRCLITPPPSPRLWAILGSHACRDHTCKAQAGQDGGMSRVFPTCLSVTLTDVSVISARIVRPPVSGATTHARASDVKSMVSQIRVWTACVRPERLESSAVRTNVKANLRLQKRLRIQVSSSHTAEILSHVSHISPQGSLLTAMARGYPHPIRQTVSLLGLPQLFHHSTSHQRDTGHTHIIHLHHRGTSHHPQTVPPTGTIPCMGNHPTTLAHSHPIRSGAARAAHRADGR